MDGVTMTAGQMTLIGLLITVAVVMTGALLWIAKYQAQNDRNTDDIKEETEARKTADDEIKEMVKEERVSRYKRDSDFTRDLRRIEDRVTRIEIRDGPDTPPTSVPFPKKRGDGA